MQSRRFQIVLSLVALLALAGVVAAQQRAGQPQGPPRITVNPLKEGAVYWAPGGGGNSGIVIGDAGVIIIDAKTTPEAAQAMIAEVAKLTPKPVTHVVLTHSDCDHVNGLTAFPPSVTIIAHENNLKEQQATLKAGGQGMPPTDRVPSVLLKKDSERMKINGTNFTFLHWAPAHTNGDVSVYLPDYKIAFTGDILTTAILIHPEKDGTLDGWFKTMQGLLRLDAETYIPGHGNNVETKAGLQNRTDENQAKRDKISALIREGKSLPEIKTAMGEPLGPGPSGCRGIPFPSFTDTEYKVQTSKKAGN
jgi:glyoxylase-like metal-dependent hydrolase (beta-lactamase superfamily II)